MFWVGTKRALFGSDQLERFPRGDGTMLAINDVTRLSSRFVSVLGLLVCPIV